MRTAKTPWYQIIALVLAGIVLVSCGGGGGGGGPTSPSISAQPQNVSVTVGDAATFAVAASGSAPLSYQWRRNGTDISGATAASYTIPGAALADNGTVFSVVVSNGSGSATSSGATLSVSSVASAGTYFLTAEVGAPSLASNVNLFGGTLPINRYALTAVDPLNTATLITVEPAGTWADVNGGRWVEGRLSAGGWTELRTRFRAYVKGDRFYKLDQVSNAGAPVGQPWTTLTVAQVCRNFQYLNAGSTWTQSNLDASLGYLIVRTPGPDATCGTDDDVARALRLNMNGTDTALTVDEPLTPITDASNSVVAFLTRSGTQVRRVDANFANGSNAFTLQTAASPQVLGVFGSAAPGTMLFLDGNQVFAYRLNGSAAPAPLLTLAVGETLKLLGRDYNEMFLAVTGTGTTRILRIGETLDTAQIGTTTETLVSAAFSTTRIVLKAANALFTVPKSGGTVTLLLAADAGWTLGVPWVSSEKVFIQTLKTSIPLGFGVHVINADGSSAQRTDNAQLFTAFARDPQPTLWSADLWSAIYGTVVIAENISTVPYLAGATLRAYDGATHAPLAIYGTLPSAPSNFGAFLTDNNRQRGYPTLMQGYETSGYGLSQLDIFLFNSGSPGLTRLTNNL